MLEVKSSVENNMPKFNKKKIELYYKKTNIGILSYFYKSQIKSNHLIDINFFYWLYRKTYDRRIRGLCIKKKNNFHCNMESFTLYYKYRNIRVNQVFFNSSPFNLLLKFKRSYSFHKLYIL